MNEPDDVSLEEPAGSRIMETASGHGSTSSSNCNDCSKQSSGDAPSANSLVVGGAQPKVRDLVCNIPNGVHQNHSSPKLNNINSLQKSSLDDEGPSTSGLCSETSRVNGRKVFNGSFAKEVDIDLDLRNNVDCQTVEKCPPPKVRSCSHEDNDSLCHESDASRLAAVCAASCNRLAEERAEKEGRLRRTGWYRPRASSDSSSDTGNDDALSGDECIYTYKGDQISDIPKSLFGLPFPPGNDLPGPVGPPPNHHQDGGSSPEMDFLEMDFDPDPSGEQESADEASEHGDLLNSPDSRLATPPHSPVPAPAPPEIEDVRNDLSAAASGSNVQPATYDQGPDMLLPYQPVEESSSSNGLPQQPTDQSVGAGPSCDINVGASTSGNPFPGSVSNSHLRPTSSCWPTRDAWGHHSSGGDLCSPGDNADTDGDSWAETLAAWNAGNFRIQPEPCLDSRKFNLHSALYHCIMAKRLVLDKQADFEEDGTEAESTCSGPNGDGPSLVQRTMIWTEQEACFRQVSQIAASSCGATAVINVLLALNIPFTLDRVKEGVATRLRADNASIPAYLFSRSMAGAAHRDLIRGLDIASGGLICSRFFHMYPERAVSLSRWLAHWIKKGAVPIATLNLQNGVAPGNKIPDSWHHQMVFGVSQRGIYLTNPLECISEAALWPQICSPSILLVRRNDIVTRWTPTTDLCRLATSSDVRWKKMNVLGQVVNVLRESKSQMPAAQGTSRALTSHVTVPASYCSGILLAILKNSPAAAELMSAPELPIQKF